MYQIIGCLPTAPQQALNFIGGQVPQSEPWKPYVITALPPGLVIQHEQLYWLTTGYGVKLIDGKPADLVTHV